jgi:hypothetical protein
VLATCGPNAGDGLSANWNNYPLTDSGIEYCYTETIVVTTATAPDTYRSFTSRAPNSANCKSLTGFD